MRKSVASLLVVGIAGVAAAAYVGTAAAHERPAPVAALTAVATTATLPALPPVDAGDRHLTYRQTGRVVTVQKGTTRVATVTLASADYTADAAEVTLSVVADRPFTVDPAMFVVYDAEGWENDPEQTTPVRVDAGARSLSLSFPETVGRPMALGWVPQDDKAAAAVWERG